MRTSLEKVADLVERGWIRDCPAQTVDGREVRAKSIEAVRWSLFGALAMALVPMSMDWDVAVDALARSAGVTTPLALLDWSEDEVRTREDILIVIRKAKGSC